MKKAKETNEGAIPYLETKIAMLDKEMEKREDGLRNLIKNSEIEINESLKPVKEKPIICKYYNKGYCRNKTISQFEHPEKICEIFQKDGYCQERDCQYRHPKVCSFWKRGYCFRGELCQYENKYNTNHRFCENCNEVALHLYYCDFYVRNFCAKCTIKETHDHIHPNNKYCSM